MTRQVALGAVVAFALTVLVLSVCQPSADATNPAPPPTPAPAPQAPVVNRPIAVPAKPMILRPANGVRPELLVPQRLGPAPAAVASDAGAQ